MPAAVVALLGSGCDRACWAVLELLPPPLEPARTLKEVVHNPSLAQVGQGARDGSMGRPESSTVEMRRQNESAYVYLRPKVAALHCSQFVDTFVLAIPPSDVLTLAVVAAAREVLRSPTTDAERSFADWWRVRQRQGQGRILAGAPHFEPCARANSGCSLCARGTRTSEGARESPASAAWR